MIEQVLAGFQAMSYWEYIAVVLGVAYLLLAMKQNIWCWPAAFASTSIYTILFWQGFLFMESVLNFYYLLMAVYGWRQWRSITTTDGLAESPKPVISWPIKKHLQMIVALTLSSMVLGFAMDNCTDAKMAYLDSFTTVFSIMTTYLVTQKVLENWLYWVVIDFVSIYIYVQLDYLPTASLFVVYTVLAVQGYFSWRKEIINTNKPALV